MMGPLGLALQGRCFVIPEVGLARTPPGLLPPGEPLICRARGASHLSQAFAVVPESMPEPLCFPGGETVIFVVAGTGAVEIAGCRFELPEQAGAYVAPGEAFRLYAGATAPLKILITVCPERAPQAGTGNTFDQRFPERVSLPARGRREHTGERWFQLGIGPRHGSTQVTQFLGHIPPSKAPEHFHLYEEALYVVSGEGRLWVGAQSAPVGPGTVAFLPVNQRHCLECTSADGMTVHGVFYPAGSPAVAYE